MKERAVALAREAEDSGQGLNRLREYLQCLVLRSLHEREAFRAIALVGGTALRLLHNLPRFSEGLYFSLIPPGGCAGRAWMAGVNRDLSLAGFDVDVTWNERNTVQVGWVRVAGILHEAGLSGMPEQKLSVKIEIDTKPPAGARCEKRLVTRELTFLLHHYDLPSLMAGKLHAVLTRKFSKGRDWYDLAWYLSRRPAVAPNLALLGNALEQTQGVGRFDPRSWRALVRDRLAALDADAMAKDVRPFLERPKDADVLTRENLMGLLEEP